MSAENAKPASEVAARAAEVVGDLSGAMPLLAVDRHFGGIALVASVRHYWRIDATRGD